MFHYKIMMIIIGLFFSACAVPQAPNSEPSMSRVVKAPSIPVTASIAMRVGAGVLESGNNNMGKVNVGEDDNNVQIEGHSYRVISLENELKKLAGVTTYVILPKNFSRTTDLKSDAYLRYERILELIQYLDKVEVNSDGSVSSFYEDENTFILFANKKDERVSLKNYDYALSNKVLKFFRKTYSNSLFREEGPFLITTIKNIWNDKEDFSFLYVNLTNFNKSAVDEIVGAYKERLIERGIDDVTTFEKWHARLLSFVTNFGSDIKIFQTAVAGGI